MGCYSITGFPPTLFFWREGQYPFILLGRESQCGVTFLVSQTADWGRDTTCQYRDQRRLEPSNHLPSNLLKKTSETITTSPDCMIYYNEYNTVNAVLKVGKVSLIARVSIVLRKTVCGDVDWHHQSQDHRLLKLQSMSPQTVLLRTTLTLAIKLNQLLTYLNVWFVLLGCTFKWQTWKWRRHGPSNVNLVAIRASVCHYTNNSLFLYWDILHVTTRPNFTKGLVVYPGTGMQKFVAW